MLNHYKKLQAQCEKMIEETEIEARKAEVRNIIAILNMEIHLMEAGDVPDNRTAVTFEECRERVVDLLAYKDSAGKHDEFREALELCDDMDKEDDL